jgi:hypothetical protein
MMGSLTSTELLGPSAYTTSEDEIDVCLIFTVVEIVQSLCMLSGLSS